MIQFPWVTGFELYGNGGIKFVSLALGQVTYVGV